MNIFIFSPYNLLTKTWHIIPFFLCWFQCTQYKYSTACKVHGFLYLNTLLLDCIATHALLVALHLLTWRSICPFATLTDSKDVVVTRDPMWQIRPVWNSIEVQIHDGFHCCTDSMGSGTVIFIPVLRLSHTLYLTAGGKCFFWEDLNVVRVWRCSTGACSPTKGCLVLPKWESTSRSLQMAELLDFDDFLSWFPADGGGGEPKIHFC